MKVIHQIAYEWALRAFGGSIVHNRPERALRVAEEAIELAQASGVPMAQMIRQVESVYSRPVGNVLQELGGVLHTVSVFCVANGFCPDSILEQEVRRVLDKPLNGFKDRMQEKIEAGLLGLPHKEGQ